MAVMVSGCSSRARPTAPISSLLSSHHRHCIPASLFLAPQHFPLCKPLKTPPAPTTTAFYFSSFYPSRVILNPSINGLRVSASSFPVASSPPDEESERAKLAQVSKRLENTSRYFRKLGNLGFWGQLVCTVVAAVILSFSVVVTGTITSPATFYATAAGMMAAFLSAFWSFGFIRLSEKLRRAVNDHAKAPPRSEVIKSLKNGIIINLLGMGAAVLGMQATVGTLVAKALTSSTTPYSQGIRPGLSPVLALDVFLVQACANTILSHFMGILFLIGTAEIGDFTTTRCCGIQSCIVSTWLALTVLVFLTLHFDTTNAS